MIKKFFATFILFLTFSTLLIARPDLRIGSIGDNLYGTFGLGGGGEATLYNAIAGKYNKISLTIDNDPDNASTTKEQIYPVSFTPPSTEWDYYIVYKGEKYTGTWATDIMSDNSSLDFDLYVKPPDGAEAVTYPFIISAIETNNLADSFTVNVNVVQQSNFDLSLLLDNGTTIGNYEYNTTSSSYTLFVNKNQRYYLNFRVKNRGNILGSFIIKLVDSQLPTDSFEIFNDNTNITAAAMSGKEYFLDNGSYTDFQLKIDGNRINYKGTIYLYIYNSTLQTVDKFTLNVSVVQSSYIYKFPYLNSGNSITALIMTNYTDSQGSVTVKNLIDNSSKDYTINAKSMAINTIDNVTQLQITSDSTIFSPLLLVIDNSYNIISSIIPYNVELTGTDMAVPLLVNLDNYSVAYLFISNDSDYSNNISVSFFNYNGKFISKKIFELAKNDFHSIKIPDILNSDNSTVYWAEIKSSYPVAAYVVNTFYNSFYKINCFQLRK